MRPSRDGSTDFRRWAAAQEPSAPEAFLRLVEVEEAGARDLSLGEVLLGRARAALRDALAGEGERRGAYRLLAADAYLTYACELALESEAASTALEQVVEGVVAEAEMG